MTETATGVEVEAAPPARGAVPGPTRAPDSRLSLPRRGDRLGRGYVLGGAAFYVGFSAVFVWSLLAGRTDKGATLLQLLGKGEHFNPAVFLLVVGGVALTVAAGFTIRTDMAMLAREEDDVDWVDRFQRQGLSLVFADPAQREGRFRRGEREMPTLEAMHVETLVDDRVRRVHEARLIGGSAHVSPEELRGIAEARTARLGSFARFASSLLLLLAVLGTFAGVKTALPSLIDAVSAAAGDGSGVQGSIVGPLRAVADAFGGNAFALVGAIAAGLMAQGLALGRRNLLERLELVSTEFIYDRSQSTSADPLLIAANALKQTAAEMGEAGQSFTGIEAGLNALGTEFRDAFDTFSERLSDLVKEQDARVKERTAGELLELRRRMEQIAQTVGENAGVYRGLVDRVEARAAESRSTMERLEQVHGTVERALKGLVRLGDASSAASERLEQSLASMGAATGQIVERMEQVAGAVKEYRPALDDLDGSLRIATERIASIDERAASAWARAADETQRKLAAMIPPPVAPAPYAVPAGGGGGGLGPDAVALLRRIAAAAETSRPPSPLLLATLPLLGLLGALAIVFAIARAGQALGFFGG